MLEPQEIDALLISALYGELTPAEETRLEIHLGSHPADKTALAALTSTREAVRASRILQVQLDPPQSVSALLLQEAARRAPRPEEREGWFARFARSFMAHPAMAAAAMLVVVIGVVTLVQNRKGDQFVETAPATAVESKPAASDHSIVASEPAKDRLDDNLDQGTVHGGEAGSNAAMGSAAFGGDSTDRFQVSLADSDGRQGKLEAQKQQNTVADGKATETTKQDPAGPRDRTGDEVAAKNAKKGATAKKPSGAYMELRSDEPTVKDFEGNANGEAAPGRGYATAPTDDVSKESVNAVTPGPGLTVGGSGGGAGNGTAVTGSAPRSNTPPATTTKSAAKAEPKAPDGQVARNAPQAASPSPPPPPPPKVATSTGTKAAAPAEDKSANDPQLAWAREQHTTIIARVRNGDCKGAASIAVVLANRDLAYYKQNVASDRSVKECLAYIDNAREKDQEQRAERSKTKRSVNEPSPTKKAADQPAKSAVDSK